MDGTADFANLYINRLLGEVIECTKARLMMETKLQFLETAMGHLVEENQSLHALVEELNAKLAKRDVKRKPAAIDGETVTVF